jgi:hypothetical protein
MSRGEAFATVRDVAKVRSMIKNNPLRIFWLPTRAWRNPELKKLIQKYIKVFPNAFVQGSTDVTTTIDEYKMLKRTNWSTLYFGNNDTDSVNAQYDIDLFKCPKTFGHKKSVCVGCTRGCFSAERKDIHLKQH